MCDKPPEKYIMPHIICHNINNSLHSNEIRFIDKSNKLFPGRYYKNH